MTVGSQVKSCYSSLKSADATIQMLAAKTQNERKKQALTEVQTIVTEVKNSLEKQVIRISQEEPQYKN